MPEKIEDLDRKPRIITAKNQEKLMDIFNKFPDKQFTQHQLHEQTQIKYPASVHSALMALIKKGKIARTQATVATENGSPQRIVYQKMSEDA